ncbi:MAG TPA: FAD-dependent oxidoreductase [Chloroflexota bacterium]
MTPEAVRKDYRDYSFWLETCGDDLTPRPSLPGSIDVDIAVLGAGYTGLWTAYYLLQRDPSLRVAIVEGEIAGFGASGRNGGWCSSDFSVTPGMLAKRYGREATCALQAAMWDTVDEVGRVCRDEEIDAHYTKGGELRVARGGHEVPLIEADHAVYRDLGLGSHYRLLTAEETAEYLRVAGAAGALYTPECATLHPGRLVRGLARAVERRGATIYEQTEVTDFRDGARPALLTRDAEVRAKTVVLAGEAYLTRLRRLHRQLMPVYSLIVLTEPLTDTQWAELGWASRVCVSSNKYVVDYLSRTADGRILFGSRGAPYHFGSRIDDAYDRHEPTHSAIEEQILAWFPSLHGIRFTHSWGGAVGMPRDWMPGFIYDRSSGIASARGYTGHGVATSNLAGRTLADLIAAVPSALTTLPPVGHRSRNWEPEPLRWLGTRYMQWTYDRIDRKAAYTGHPPTGKTLPEWLGRH